MSTASDGRPDPLEQARCPQCGNRRLIKISKEDAPRTFEDIEGMQLNVCSCNEASPTEGELEHVDLEMSAAKRLASCKRWLDTLCDEGGEIQRIVGGEDSRELTRDDARQVQFAFEKFGNAAQELEKSRYLSLYTWYGQRKQIIKVFSKVKHKPPAEVDWRMLRPYLEVIGTFVEELGFACTISEPCELDALLLWRFQGECRRYLTTNDTVDLARIMFFGCGRTGHPFVMGRATVAGATKRMVHFLGLRSKRQHRIILPDLESNMEWKATLEE